MPETTRKIILCFDKFPISFVSPFANTMHQTIIKMIIVRMPVARFELILATPNLAKIAVSEANKAESIA
jgi:2-oxo-4-hydroxy-4-carboxy--5-ureidoimidazoline (OHCU) decarboxylase